MPKNKPCSYGAAVCTHAKCQKRESYSDTIKCNPGFKERPEESIICSTCARVQIAGEWKEVSKPDLLKRVNGPVGWMRCEKCRAH